MAANKSLTPRINRIESNLIIDSGAEIWPEGTSRSVTSGLQLYGSVMTRLANVASSVTLTNSQQASVPSGSNIPFSNQVSKSGAGTLAAGTNVNISTFIEGYDISKIYNQAFSVIFWVKSTVASQRSVVLLNAAQTHTYIKQYTITAANTWQLVALSFPALNTCPGTIERQNLAGIQIATTVVAGSTFQTATTNAWVSGNFRSGTGEDTTWLTGTTHDFSIAGMQVLPGDWSSLVSNTSSYVFLRRGKDIQEELSKSQRYFEKTFPAATAPAAATSTGGHLSMWPGAATAAGDSGVVWQFKVTKRAAPTITTYNPYVAGNGFARSGAGDEAVDATFTDDNATTIRPNTAITANGTYQIHGVADARF